MSTSAINLDSLLFAGASARATLVDGVTVTADGESDSFSGFEGLGGLLVRVEATKVSGTTPELSVAVQHSDDGETFPELGVFTAFTADGAQILRITSPPLDYLRLSYDITGTGAAFTIRASVVPLLGFVLPSYAAAEEGDTLTIDEFGVPAWVTPA